MKITYLSTGNVQLKLTTVRTHKSTELLANTLKSTQPVVLGKSVEEVLQDVALVSAASELLQLVNDLLLVGGREGRGADDGGELAVVLEGLAEGGEGLGDLVEGGGFGGGSVLFINCVSGWCCFWGGFFVDAIGFSDFLKVGSTESCNCSHRAQVYRGMGGRDKRNRTKAVA